MMEEYVDEFAQENYNKGRKDERVETEKREDELTILSAALAAQNRIADMIKIIKDHAFRETVARELFPNGIGVAPN